MTTFLTELNDGDSRTLVWLTQDDADAAEDGSNVIATITETDA